MNALMAIAMSLLPAVQEPGYTKDRVFPDFLLPNVDGGFGRLSDYRGRKVLVFNFASW